MLMAAIGDMTGGARALGAVLDALDEEGVLTVACCGNFCAAGAAARETLELARAREVHCIQGPLDHAASRFVRRKEHLRERFDEVAFMALEEAHAALDGAAIEFLCALPKRRDIELDGHAITLCYGAPSGATRPLSAAANPDRFEREREFAAADIVLCGSGEAPFSRMVHGALFVNPGPLLAGPGIARYALISTEENPWEATIREVKF